MSIQQNLEHILSRIRAAELRAGRPAGSVRLVAVSKTFPAEDVKACHDAGQRIFGENKVQEGLAKIPSLPPDTEWHLIGPLQRNKVRKALEYFTLIHAVDSLRLARFMDTVAQETGKRPRILLEVNVGNEDSKFGFFPETLEKEWPELSSLNNRGRSHARPRRDGHFRRPLVRSRFVILVGQKEKRRVGLFRKTGTARTET